ncbi:MAG: radical SAM protein [Treponema sp.]|nr:radical SAM protein [Treponema sp.]
MTVRNGMLRSVYFHITEKCEHCCGFCYAKFGLGGFCHAEFSNVKKIVDIVSNAGVKNFSFVGGDPVLHPQIVEILQYARTTMMNITLMTNTARIPNTSVKEVAPFVDVLMISIHGDSAIQHDSVSTVDGSYENLIAATKEFQDNGVKIEVAFNITSKTFNQIFSSIEELTHKGIKVTRYVLQCIAPIMDKDGLIILSNDEYTPKKSQINIAMSQIKKIKEKYNIPIELVDPFPLCIVDKAYHDLVTPCKCGLTDLSINGNGDIARCGADPNYQLGNILSTPEDDLISSLWQHSNELMRFRAKQYLPKQCKTCSLKLRCGGGCASRCNVFRTLGQSHLDIFEEESIYGIERKILK